MLALLTWCTYGEAILLIGYDASCLDAVLSEIDRLG